MCVYGWVFFLMEYVLGVVVGCLFSVGVGIQGWVQLVVQFGVNLVCLYQVCLLCVVLDFLLMLICLLVLVIIDVYCYYFDIFVDVYLVLEWGLCWCELYVLCNSILCLLYCDYCIGNYLVSEQGFEVVFDWEFIGWGDFCEDLGWFIVCCWCFICLDFEVGGIG